MVSNLRDDKSESGMVTPNSSSRPVTKSVRANESNSPETNSDSSAPGLISFPDTFCRILRIRACGSICHSLRRSFAAICCPFLVCMVAGYQVGQQRVGQRPVSLAGEVGVVCLRQARVNPVLHRPQAAHPLALVPVRAPVGPANCALRLNDVVGSFVGMPGAMLGKRTVGHPYEGTD